MIFIRKSREPGSLLEYRHKKFASFDGMDEPVKSDLRRSLLCEQGHICAYCMCEIDDKTTKIEHLVARNKDNELVYGNLLAVCMGNEGQPPERQHCDTRKGNRPLSLSPLNESDMARIYYSNSGRIHSEDKFDRTLEYDNDGRVVNIVTNPDRDLEECLNLNDEYGEILKARKTALQSLRKEYYSYSKLSGKKHFLKKMNDYYAQMEDHKKPYVGILVWFIANELKK
ncbi:MAG: hypothetical protein IKO16_08140 [Lachnospiraceae bacterium]|nr:hypothetical protein [Lachnospiraceae bacterium]